MIIDGKAIAADILVRTNERASRLPEPPRILFYAPLQTPATASYLKIKTTSAEAAGCRFEETDSPASFADADAGIVQLPLPEGVDVRAVCDSVPPEKDADVLSYAARQRFEKGEEDALLPPVVGAIAEIFERQDVNPEGKQAVVVGSGFLVGAPTAAWLRHGGADVVVLDRSSGDLAEALKDADIVVSGAGSPHLIKPDMLREGVVLVDAGTSESDGVVVGDADPACEGKCAVFTPVPGGVGPIAVAKLFENAVTLAERATHR